jgi:hypothetical protein
MLGGCGAQVNAALACTLRYIVLCLSKLGNIFINQLELLLDSLMKSSSYILLEVIPIINKTSSLIKKKVFNLALFFIIEYYIRPLILIIK